MPARIEVFDAENRRHNNALRERFLVAAGGAALLLAGMAMKSTEVILGGGAVAIAAGIYAGSDSIRHDQTVHRLNMQKTQQQGEV